jgi:hypothetical protein
LIYYPNFTQSLAADDDVPFPNNPITPFIKLSSPAVDESGEFVPEVVVVAVAVVVVLVGLLTEKVSTDPLDILDIPLPPTTCTLLIV